MRRHNGQMLVTLSGGFDSAAALLYTMQHHPVVALFVDYNQRYLEQERRAIHYLTQECEAISGRANFHGIIEVKLNLGFEYDTPYVPYRNLVISAIAANWALANNAVGIVTGSKSARHRPGDPVSYLDSTLDFYDELNRLLARTTEDRHLPAPLISMPLVGWDKYRVLRLLHNEGVDLGELWNCYREDGIKTPCGICHHCKETLPLIAAVTGGDGEGAEAL